MYIIGLLELCNSYNKLVFIWNLKFGDEIAEAGELSLLRFVAR
jgi:hypothetical protein